MITGLEAYEREEFDALDHAIARMERNGFCLDVDYLSRARADAEVEERTCLEELGRWTRGVGWEGEVNWASPLQVVRLLHEHLNLEPSPVWKKGRVKLHKGERKTDETALGWLHDRAPGAIKRGLGELVRLRRTRGAVKYLSKLPGFIAPDGFVHPVSGPSMDSDDRAGTITWRLASKNPEVMQIPTDPTKDPYRIRRGFVAPPGYGLLVADESALEVVILGHILIRLFGDGSLAEMSSPGAPDFHSVNARRVFGEFLRWEVREKRVDQYPLGAFKSEEFPELVKLRQDIKAVWYGLMYGKGAYGFATSLRDAQGHGVGEEAAQRIIDALFHALPGIPRYQRYVQEYVRRHHGVPGLSGAWCDLSELCQSGREWDLRRAERIGLNYPMQEGGARVIGRAMVEIDRDEWLWDAGVRVERQIHDELDFRYPLDADLVEIKRRVERAMTSYPLESTLSVKMGVGENWDAAKN